MRLVAAERDVPFGEGTVEQAREIINVQIAPVAEPTLSAVPPGTQLRSLFVGEHGDAYVNLSRELSSSHEGGSLNELLTVYTIVNALTVNLPAVSSVQVLVEGKATTAWDVIRLRRRTGYVIQEAGLFPHFTVADNVALVPQLDGWDEARIHGRVHELLDLVGLDPERFAERYPRELSGGQRQRVGVARALAADPPLLLMDEPFGALDPLTRASLQREFAELKARLGKTVIFVTHDVREALALGSRIALMDKGQIVVLETPKGFVSSNNQLARAYLETLRNEFSVQS